MKNKIIKKIMLILISILLILNIPLYSNANSFSFDSLLQNADSFLSEGSSSTASGITPDSLQPISVSISNILLAIAVGVILITAAMMAISFMVQSVEDKAKIKEAMVPWIIGVFITSGAFGIWRITMMVMYDLL